MIISSTYPSVVINTVASAVGVIRNDGGLTLKFGEVVVVGITSCIVEVDVTNVVGIQELVTVKVPVGTKRIWLDENVEVDKGDGEDVVGAEPADDAGEDWAVSDELVDVTTTGINDDVDD